MRKPHELDEPLKRRAAIGLLGGFVATLATAPAWHARTVLDVDVDLDGFDYEAVARRSPEQFEPAAVAIDLELANREDVELEPMFTTWDHRRKTRYRWSVEDGPEVLRAGERADYRIEAPNEEASLLAGFRAQLTVWQLGEEHWRAIHFTTPDREVPIG
jgi:hypothetical protein